MQNELDGYAGRPVCGLWAVAKVTGFSFSDVEKKARKICQRKFTGATSVRDREQILTHLGVNYITLKWQGYSLQKFVYQIANKNTLKKFIVRVRGHVVVVAAGLVYDQDHPYGITASQHPSARQHVTHVTVCM